MIRDEKLSILDKMSGLSFRDRRLGESKKTVLSHEKHEEESRIKVEESMIVIDYFHPKESQLNKWL